MIAPVADIMSDVAGFCLVVNRGGGDGGLAIECDLKQGRLEGQDDQHQPPDFVCKDKAFVNQDVPLVPATDAERAKMIRSSRWGGS